MTVRQKIIEELQFFREYAGFPKIYPDGPDKPPDAVAKRQFDALVVALQERASSAQHLQQIMLELQRSMKFCPKPPEIHEAAERVAERRSVREWRRPSGECAQGGACGGTGFVVSVDADGISSAARCLCRAGHKSAASESAKPGQAAAHAR